MSDQTQQTMANVRGSYQLSDQDVLEIIHSSVVTDEVKELISLYMAHKLGLRPSSVEIQNGQITVVIESGDSESGASFPRPFGSFKRKE